jgi:hypothetical protein
MPDDVRLRVVEQHTISDVIANDHTAAGDENGPSHTIKDACVKREPFAISERCTFSDPLELSCRSREATYIGVSLL